MSNVLPAFSLQDASGADHSFPAACRSILAFVKEDCPTCNLVMPLIEALHGEPDVAVVAPGQTTKGNAILMRRHALTLPILDDSALKASFAFNVETVPLVIAADADGAEEGRLVGFDKGEWQAFFARFAPGAQVDWDAYPDWRPGCGSLTQDPIVAERLQAEAENSPLRARRIDIAQADDVHEFMFDQGFTDGLPVVPPTPERVLRMLAGTQRDPQSVVATLPPHMAPATVEKLAVNAVMAGCKPDHLPVIIAAIEALCTDEFNVHGVMATTMAASPVLVVNGPIRERLDMNMRLGVLGQGNRANAAIGRGVRLALRNIGGARPGGTERSTFGNPMKFTMCFPEWEERSGWPPLHVERGFQPEDSVVTAFALTSGPQLIVEQVARQAAQLGGSLGLTMASMHHPRAYNNGDCLLVVSPEHLDAFIEGGYSKDDLRERIQSVSAKPLRELVADESAGGALTPERAAAMPKEALDRTVRKFASNDNIHIVVAGSEAGSFSAFFHGWASGPMGSIPVSRKIES